MKGIFLALSGAQRVTICIPPSFHFVIKQTFWGHPEKTCPSAILAKLFLTFKTALLHVRHPLYCLGSHLSPETLFE